MWRSSAAVAAIRGWAAGGGDLGPGMGGGGGTSVRGWAAAAEPRPGMWRPGRTSVGDRRPGPDLGRAPPVRVTAGRLAGAEGLDRCLVALVERPLPDALGGDQPARASACRWAVAVGCATSSLSAMNSTQTPLSTRSPSRCGGKCATGSRSQSRICSRLGLARARNTSAASKARAGVVIPSSCRLAYSSFLYSLVTWSVHGYGASSSYPRVAGWHGSAELHPYFVCDVFTSEPLEGNQLGVFPDGRPLLRADAAPGQGDELRRDRLPAPPQTGATSGCGFSPRVPSSPSPGTPCLARRSWSAWRSAPMP